MTISSLQDHFQENHGVLTSKELLKLGLSYYKIRQLLHDKILEKVKRGVYTFRDNSEDELGLLTKLIPKGVFCFHSAAYIYNYTTSIPLKHHVAVHHKANLNLPDFPPIKLYYWQKNQYQIGVIKKEVNGVFINIYDREKTICDYIKFRNKLEVSMVKEVLQTYLSDSNRNIVQLKKYSRELRISTILDHYLELLI
ncbi:MAG: type IV toxin-antitoxin system AbiEi family antitoxin domain-containing protein [Bacteroidota bacterium]